MANKLTTLGYTLKRFRDSGFITCKLFAEYGQNDPRAWTIIIDPGNTSVLCTCFINDTSFGESFFELYDGNQYIPGRLKIKTSSFEVLVEHLYEKGIFGNAKTAASVS
tara:strand:+ start:640 stop:963 length:324 start_codon:yes stop_codon:yes gene_type:complete